MHGPSFAIATRGRAGALHRTIYPSPAALLTAALLVCLPSAGRARADDDDRAPAEPEVTVSDTLTVTDTRLRDRPAAVERVPAHVTAIDRDAIERSGARTLQELLELEAGVVLYDQVGNDLSKTLDLRGFSGGSGTKVFLDGAPINDPRSNSLALELVPMAALERVEITRGSAAALAGGGSEAGVINLWTRSEGARGGRLRLAAGADDAVDLGGWGGGRAGAVDLFVSASSYETDGFRENAAGELLRGAATAGWALSDAFELDLSLIAGAGDFGEPGALTVAELGRDREAAPFNRLDFSDESFGQATVNLSGLPGGEVHLFVRDRGSEILTTGRATPVFGGFFLDSEAEVAGATVQLERRWSGAGGEGRLAAGVEGLEGETVARGFSTPAADPGRVTPAGLGSDNTADRTDLGLWLEHRWVPAPAWSLTAGARYDRVEVGYAERRPDPANAAAREFSELSLRAGVNWAPSDRLDLYLSFGEGFLPPSVEELFSFPLFGSNRDLEPEDSRTVELGARRRLAGGGMLTAALFAIDTTDEIVFDPDSPLGLFGANVNAGEAERRGFELAWRGRPGGRATTFANLTLVDAELARGPDAGNTLPLVPEERFGVGVDLALAPRLDLRAAALWVGEQVLANDEANRQPRLDAYTVVDLRLAWRPGPRGAVDGGGLGLFLEARNLLDESYATRGIFAFDFSTFTDEVFLTPAPGRRLSGGVEWSF